MILAAALLVLVGLGLFVAGILTGTTVLYWGCVAVCVIAAILLVVVRRSLPRDEKSEPTRGARKRVVSDRPATADRPADRAPAVDQPSAEVQAVPLAEARRSETPPPAPPQVPTAVEIPAVRSASDAPTGAHAMSAEPAAPVRPPADDGEPPVEEVEVTDLLLVVDLHDEVLVVDEHPRYHLGGCPYLTGRPTIPLPVDEARADGFTPCGICTPDRQLADRVRSKRSTAG